MQWVSGAWEHYCDGDSISHIREQNALGWMEEPKEAWAAADDMLYMQELERRGGE